MFNLHGNYGSYPQHACKTFEYDDNTKRLRKYLTEFIYANGRPPSFVDFVENLNLTQQEVWDSMCSLQTGVQLMFVPGTQSVGKMPPFSFYPTRHHVFIEDGRDFWAGCAGEACAFSLEFPGLVCTIESICPASWQTITTVWKDGSLLSYSPDSAILHFGIHPNRWHESMIPVCDSIDFFHSNEQVANWEKTVPEHRGARMSLESAQEWVKQIAGSRYANYDRGPDVPGDPNFAARLIASLSAAGADVSNWIEDQAGESSAA